jgi:hypothetical protein
MEGEEDLCPFIKPKGYLSLFQLYRMLAHFSVAATTLSVVISHETFEAPDLLYLSAGRDDAVYILAFSQAQDNCSTDHSRT